MLKKIIYLLLLNCFVTQAQTLNHYFGNIHAHTSYSDGNKDSSISGMTTPLQAFNYAKQSTQIDFYGISEHNHYSAGMPAPMFYQRGLNDADAATVDGQFVAMYGMEWGVISSGGHLLVYGFDSLCGWDFGLQEIFVNEADYSKLYQTINRKTGSFAYLAHPQYDDYDNLFNLSYNSVADEAIVGLALRSGPAFSTNTTYSNPSTSTFLSRYNDALRKGYHLGPGIDHDTHYSVFGRQTAGRLVLLAPILNRNELYNAFRQRRFYASDDWNTKVDFNILNQPMGSIITHAGNPTLNIAVNDPDGESLLNIAVFSGIAGSGNAPTQLTSVNNSNTLSYTQNINSNQPYYYYLLITQADGNKIWTAPIWYTRDDNYVDLLPVADFDTLVTVCSNNSVVLHDNSLNAPTSWWWTANGAYPVNSSLQHPTFNFPNPGIYQIKMVATNTAGSDTITKTIVVQTSPTVQAFSVDSICKGTSTQLSASGADNYVWSNGASDAMISVSPLVTSTYTVSGWQAGCYDTAMVTVKVYQALQTPVIYNIGDTLESSYASGNQWYYYNTLIAGASAQQFVPTLPGIYQVQVSDSMGCQSEFSLPEAVAAGLSNNDLILSDTYKIYPNPSQGVIHINSEMMHYNVRFKVLSLTGYTVYELQFAECSFNKPITINLSHLSKGIYIVKLETEAGVFESKLQLE